MAKHLPPPKNKHLSQKSSKHNAAKTVSKERDILNERSFSVKPLISCLISGILLIVLRSFSIVGPVRTVLYLLPLLVVSAGVVKRLIEKLSAGDYYEEDIIMLFACTACFCIGKFSSATAAMLIYRLGEAVTDYMVSRCRSSMDEMVSMGIRKANVLRNGRVFTLKPDKVKLGDILIVSPGEMIPLDGEVCEGMSAVDTSVLSGEKRYVNVAPGSPVLAGCINKSRDIKVKVTREYDSSAYTLILDNLMDQNRKKAKPERFVSRFAAIYTPVAVLLAIILAVVPPIFNGLWKEWIEKGVIFLILSCPCALTISVPLSYLSGLMKSSVSGIHIKNAHVLDELSRAETFVFDKTGTITDGKYFIAGIYPEGVSENKLIRAAAEAERYSKHPVARTIRQLCKTRELGENEVVEVDELHGQGISAHVDGHHVYVGNASLLEENGIRYNVPTRAGAAIHVAVDGVYWGYILVSDRVKNGAFDALEGMRRQGVRNMVLLTGDVRSVSRTLASSLNFDIVKAELMPESKVAAVEYLMATKGERSALGFVGDSENDRETLSRADIGVALGALNAEMPFGNSEVAIMSDDLAKLPKMMEIGRLTARVVWINVLAVLGVKAALMLLGALGFMPVALAAGLDTFAFIFSMLNTTRIMKDDKENKK